LFKREIMSNQSITLRQAVLAELARRKKAKLKPATISALAHLNLKITQDPNVRYK